MRIKIDFTGPKLSEQLLRWEQSKVDDLTPAMREIGRFTKTQVQLGFRSSRSPYGAPWAPLVLRSGQPLRDTGQLMGSIDFRARDNRMVIGTSDDKKKAMTHQFGATIVPRSASALKFSVNGVFYQLQKAVIPARPYLPTNGLPSNWQPHYIDALADHLKGRG